MIPLPKCVVKGKWYGRDSFRCQAPSKPKQKGKRVKGRKRKCHQSEGYLKAHVNVYMQAKF